MTHDLTLSVDGFTTFFLKEYGTLEEFKYNSGFFYKKYITKNDVFFDPNLQFLYKNTKINMDEEEEQIFDNIKDFRPFCDKQITGMSRKDWMNKMIRREVKKQIKKVKNKKKKTMSVKNDAKNKYK